MRVLDRISLIAISLILYSLEVSAQEIRVGVDYEKELPAKMEFNGKFELRNTLVPQHTFYTIFQVGLKHEIIKYLSLGGTFRQSLTPAGRSESLLESLDEKRRYTGELDIKYPRFDNGVRLSYRLRYQYSVASKGKSNEYLRSKLKADYKLIKELQPYLALEPYFHLEDKEIRKGRLYVGSKINVLRIGIEVRYIFEAKIHDKFAKTSHMIGINLEL